MLDTWHDGVAKSAIVDFVTTVTNAGPQFVGAEERVAVFDNDGTLWCEKPAYIQLDFLVRRLAEQAGADPTLRDRQPYQAAAAGDLSWFDGADVKVIAGAILSAYQGLTVEE